MAKRLVTEQEQDSLDEDITEMFCWIRCLCLQTNRGYNMVHLSQAWAIRTLHDFMNIPQHLQCLSCSIVHVLVGLNACILTAAAVKLQAMLHKPWQHSSPPACIMTCSPSILKCHLSVQSCRTAVAVHLGCMTNKQLFVPKDGFHSTIILFGCNHYSKAHWCQQQLCKSQVSWTVNHIAVTSGSQ